MKLYAQPMKCSKKGQNFAITKNTIDVLFETCWTPCKKPHLSSWSRSKFVLFWYTLYFHSYSVAQISNVCLTDAQNMTVVNIQTSHPFLHRKYGGCAPILRKLRENINTFISIKFITKNDLDLWSLFEPTGRCIFSPFFTIVLGYF